MFRHESFFVLFAAAPYSVVWTLCYSLLVDIAFVLNHPTAVHTSLGTQGNSIGYWDSCHQAKVASPVKGVIRLPLFDPSSSSVASRDCPFQPQFPLLQSGCAASAYIWTQGRAQLSVLTISVLPGPDPTHNSSIHDALKTRKSVSCIGGRLTWQQRTDVRPFVAFCFAFCCRAICVFEF